jgi:hypothetical protein
MVDKIMDNLDVLFSVTRINECFSISMSHELFGIVDLISKKSITGIRFSHRATIQIRPSENGSAGDCSFTSTSLAKRRNSRRIQTRFSYLIVPAGLGKTDGPPWYIRRENSSDNFARKERLQNHQ